MSATQDEGTTPVKKSKTPARPVAEIRAEIAKERAALDGAFAALRRDLDEAVEAGRRRAQDAVGKARVIGPVVVGGVVALTVAARLLRRRSARKE